MSKPETEPHLARHAAEIDRQSHLLEAPHTMVWEQLAAEMSAARDTPGRTVPSLATATGRWFRRLEARTASAPPCCKPCGSEPDPRDENPPGNAVCHDLPLIKQLNVALVGTGGYDAFAGVLPQTRPSGFGFQNELYEHTPADGIFRSGAIRIGWARAFADLDGPRALLLAPRPGMRAMLQAALEIDCGLAGMGTLHVSWNLQAHVLRGPVGVTSHMLSFGTLKAISAAREYRQDLVPNGMLPTNVPLQAFLVGPQDGIRVVLTIHVRSVAIGATARCFFERIELEGGDPDLFWRLCEV